VLRRGLPGGRRISTWAAATPPPRRRTVRLGAPAFDGLAVLATLVLVVAGLANLAVVDGQATALRQAVIAAVGLVLFGVFRRVRVRLLGVLGVVAYVVAVVTLAAVPVVGLSANGATRWIGVGAFTFQPSELAKLGMLLVLAGVLASGRPAWQRFAGAQQSHEDSLELRDDHNHDHGNRNDCEQDDGGRIDHRRHNVAL